LDQKSEAEVGSINVPEYGYAIIHDAYSGVFHIIFQWRKTFDIFIFQRDVHLTFT